MFLFILAKTPEKIVKHDIRTDRRTVKEDRESAIKQASVIMPTDKWSSLSRSVFPEH